MSDGWYTGRLRQKLQRGVQRRWWSKAKPKLVYFHRVDDPYCQLLVQVLPEILERFDVMLEPHIVERLPAHMYPHPHRYEAYSILDAARIARLYGLGFSNQAIVPDRLAVGMAARHLASLENDPAAFLEAAQDLGVILWRQEMRSVREVAGQADLTDLPLWDNERTMTSLGCYESATLVFEGETYHGLDRLQHMEKRLNDRGLGDGRVRFNMHRQWQVRPRTMLTSPLSGSGAALFFSLDCPFSYLMFEHINEISRMVDIPLTFCPTPSFKARNLAPPPIKRRAHLIDAGREARLSGYRLAPRPLPENQMAENQLNFGLELEEERQFFYFRDLLRYYWGGGKSLPGEAISVRPAEASRLDANLQTLLAAGGWGSPVLRMDGELFWGQDRLDSLLGRLYAD